MEVGGDEVDRRARDSHLLHRGADRLPPAVGAAGIADVGAADRSQGHLAEPVADRVEGVLEAEGPGLLEADPVLLGRSDRFPLSALGHVLKEGVHLVPLQLVGDEGRHQVVDVGGRRDQRRHRFPAIVVPTPAAGGRLNLLPAQDVNPELGPYRAGALAEDDPAAMGDRGRQPAGRVDQGAHVDHRLRGMGVERALHPDVGLLECLDPDLARALQHRRVGPHVELDRMPSRGAQPKGAFHSGKVYLRWAIPRPYKTFTGKAFPF